MIALDEQTLPARPNRRLADVEPLEQPPAMRAPWSALVVLFVGAVFLAAGVGLAIAEVCR